MAKSFVKKNKKCPFRKLKSLFELTKVVWRRYHFFVSSDKLLSFLKGHFLFFFWRRILPFLLCFCFVCFSVCPTLFTLFNGLFAPTSRSPMSKLYRYSESLAKSNGKKWSQVWNFLLKIVYNCQGEKSFLRIFSSSFVHSV